ncbi:MAG: cysteine desulfurase family protein, partial [Acidimicrobiales bacterium]
MPEGAATPVTSSGRHYLDHASTTPLRPAARVLMTEWLERLGSAGGVGDPARIHEEGRVVREAVEAAREQVASLCHVSPSRIVFTSGATEAANTAIADAVAKRPGSPMVAAAVEHSCVREAAERLAPVLDPGVGPDATVDVASLEQLLVDHREGRDLALVNCQWANHEVGTVQPVEAVSALCRPGSRASPAAVPLHVDAAAAAGHMGIDVGELGADYVSLSAHKLGGPPGVGALVLGRGVRLRPLIAGGAQERARRAGMENVLGVVGFGAAADAIEAALPAEAALARRLTDRIVAAASAIRGVR